MIATATAAPWRFGAQATAAEIYTDNVTAQTDDRKDSDLVTEVNPSVSISRQGARIGMDAGYDFIGRYFYRDNSRNNVNHGLNARGDAELVKRRLFVNAASRYSQRIVDPSQRFNIDNLGATGNRSNVWSSSVGSRWQSRFGRLAESRVRYTYNYTTNDAVQLTNTKAQQVNANLSSGAAFSRFSWQFDAAKSRSAIGGSINTVDTQAVFVEAGYALYRRVRLSLRLGHEKNPRLVANNANQQQVTNGVTKTAILNYQPTRRLSLTATYGERSFGETYEGSVVYQTARTSLQASAGRGPFGDTYGGGVNWLGRRGQVGISYTESLTTRSFLELQRLDSIPRLADASTGELFPVDDQGNPVILDPNAEVAEVSVDVFFPVLANSTFIRKVLRANTSLKGRRNTITTGASYEQRIFEETSIRDKSYRANIGWQLTLNKRADVKVDVNRQYINAFVNKRYDDIWTFSSQYTHKLGKKASASLSYKYLLRDVSDEVIDQSENQVRASFTMRL